MAKLIYMYGAMNSLKSGQLIADYHRLTADGKRVLVVKPALDTRDGAEVKSRALPLTVPAYVLQAGKERDFTDYVGKLRPRTVLVDEVQFFTPAMVEALAFIVDAYGVTVKAYGLLTDFKTELFTGSKRIIELANVIERIRSECTECTDDGVVNARMVNGKVVTEGEQIVTGAEELYKVLCRKCFYKKLS